MSQSLSHALKADTSAAHERAEKSSFIDDLVQGRACRAAYTALTLQLVHIYDELEDAIARHTDHPVVAAVDDRRLDRREALRRDVESLTGPDAPESPALPATRAYMERLRDADAETVLAHHYVRYLGDLSGGQIIARLVQRYYGIPDSAVNFYRFDELDKIKPYKDNYRAILDSLELTEEQRERVLAAAIEAFELNEAVFAELGGARAASHEAAGVSA